MLIPRRYAVSAAVVALSCLAGVLALGVHFHDAQHAGPVDRALDGWVSRTFPAGFLRAVLQIADLPVVLTVLGLVVATGLWRRRLRLAIVAVLGPALAITLTEVVLKPWVGRRSGGALAYPSGHESGVASTAAVLGLLLLTAAWPARARIAAALGLAVIVVLVAISLVGEFYHYATDTIGAVGLSTACVLGVALGLDAISAYRPRPARAPS